MRAVVVLTAVILAATSLFAKRSLNAPHPNKQFARLDTNGDGRISLAEFQSKGGKLAKRAKKFKRLDSNGDGYLSFEEFVARRSH